MSALPWEIVQGLLASQGAPEPPPDEQVATPFPTPGGPHGYLDRLALALRNVQPPQPGPRYEGDSQGGANAAGFLSGLAGSFSGNRVAEMQKRQRLEEALNTQAHDQNVRNAEATNTARDLKTYEAKKKIDQRYERGAAPDNAVETITGEDGRPVIVKRADAVGKSPYVKPDAPVADEAIMSPAAIQKRVELFLAGGPEPSFGMGKAGVANRVAFNNALAGVPQSGADIQSGRSTSAAEKSNLTNITKIHGAATAFEETALANTAILEKALHRLPDAGSAFLNKPLRAIMTGTGSKSMAAFNTARQVVVPEFTRLLNSPSAAGVISDAARKEMNVIIDPDATIGQIKTAIAILKQDAANRTKSYQDEINESQRRISQIGVAQPSTASKKWVLVNGKLVPAR